jgi:predicted enzyme related to lactoylglutathione lyase
MNRVVHFEIHADDPERAKSFYSALFGWKITKWDGPIEYWLIETGPKTDQGIDGGMLRRRAPIDGLAVIAYVCTIDCENIEATMATAQKLGAAIALPKTAIPGVGWMAYLKDTEGNIFGVMQSDMAAR